MEITLLNNDLENKSNIELKRKKKPLWTKEEDEILLIKGKEYHYKNWKLVASFLPGHTSIQCSARFRRIQSGIIKGNWKKEEDEKLLNLYKKYGKNWAKIANEMHSRTGKQIRDRFLNSLDEKINKNKFSEKEDEKIIELYKTYGNCWSNIAKHLNGRTGDMVKNRFYSRLNKIINKSKNHNRNEKEIEKFNNSINGITNNDFDDLDFKNSEINNFDNKNIHINENEISNLIIQNHFLYNQIILINSYLNFNFILKEFLNQKQDIH
jgi:myb proto-oncogene protein